MLQKKGTHKLSRQSSSRRTRILHVSYSPILLFTRNLMLLKQGYSVVSVLGNDQAINAAAKPGEGFNVILIGHCAELSVRRECARALKEMLPHARLVALRSVVFLGEVDEADLNTDSESPDEWLGEVRRFAA
jgi:hypothetical protein